MLRFIQTVVRNRRFVDFCFRALRVCTFSFSALWRCRLLHNHLWNLLHISNVLAQGAASFLKDPAIIRSTPTNDFGKRSHLQSTTFFPGLLTKIYRQRNQPLSKWPLTSEPQSTKWSVQLLVLRSFGLPKFFCTPSLKKKLVVLCSVVATHYTRCSTPL